MNVKKKGDRGEREFAAWISDLLHLSYTPKRNLEQTRTGGPDLFVPPFVFEVKRCEKLDLRKWWIKLWNEREDLIPVLAFRRNSGRWNFLISAKLIDLEAGFIRLEESEGVRWLKVTYENSMLDGQT